MPPKHTQKRQRLPPDTSTAPAIPNRHPLYGWVRALILLFVTAAVSPVSQLTLAPVFGAGPSSVNHETMITITFASGLLASGIGSGLSRSQRWLPVWTAWMPAIQSVLLPFAARLGPVGGPIVNGFLSCHTILIPTAYAIPHALAMSGIKENANKWTPRRIFILITTTLIFRLLEGFMTPRFAEELALSYFMTPVHLQLFLAAVHSVVFPSWMLIFAIPAFFHAQFMNPHFSHAAVNASLRPHNWTLLERQWSNTGYISVLDSFDMQYRVMRCDHSLLGGEWLLTEDRKQKQGWKVSEPIYAVFQMLEAVRLMELEPAIPDPEAQALVIGLGIGTAPKALVAHGIQTTIVELDPIVHDFATKYFDLPANHTAVIQDAVSWVQDEAALDKRKYDYIIHDVFTGGTEPLSLFNAHFLRNLRSLLNPDGIIAINYAGDLAIPLTATVLNTIDTVFSHQCKIYRDAPPEKDALTNPSDSDSDFLNMVVFCRNSPGDITFRKPRQADYLGSKSRQYYMLPKPEHELAFPHRQQTTNSHSDASYNARQGGQQQDLLELGDEGKFDAEQGRSAVRHWRIMRKVLPDAVWDHW